MTSVIVETYSEKAIVVRNTLEHHGSMLTSLGGTFNERLKGGRGWIFPKHMLTQVRNMIEKLNSGQYGNEYEQKTSSASAPVDMVSKSDYLSLLSRVERLEALVLKSSAVSASTVSSMTASVSASAATSSASTVVKSSVPEMKPMTKKKELTPPKYDVPDWVDDFEEPVEKKRLVPMKCSK